MFYSFLHEFKRPFSSSFRFTFCLALLDYLETLLNFQPLVFANIDRTGVTSGSSNNCRLAALTQCVQDCAALYDLSLKAMIKLHTMVAPDMLSGHRDRFNSLYFTLERFFVRANTYPFICNFLKIPLLPNVSLESSSHKYLKQLVIIILSSCHVGFLRGGDSQPT